MAETLGIASGIAGLVSLTVEVFGISCKYINGVRNASCSARRLLKELEALQTVLHRVEQVANDRNKPEAFGDSGPFLLSIEGANEYINLLQNIRGKLQQRQSHSAFRNHVKALVWPFSEKETLILIESFHRHLEIYNTALAVDSLTIGRFTLNEVNKVNVSQADSRNKEILDWLSPLTMYQKQQDILSRRHGKTGSWLLMDPVFRTWINSDFSQWTLWCPGNPGTGKTVITSVVIDHLANNYSSADTKVAYVYCDYKDQAAQTASKLIACLARQIIGRPQVLPQPLAALHKELEQQNRRPSFDELKRLLTALCKHYARTYILVDALDECEAVRERRLLLPVLRSLPSISTRLFVTSRPNNEDIFQSFSKASQIDIIAHEWDLRRYIMERMEERGDFVDRLTPELKENITSTITAGASGMFLLAALQIDRVFSTRTIKGVKSALTSMPSRLEELYQQTIGRIQQQAGDDGALGMRILSWITHAKRPLLVDELRHGLAVEYNDDKEDLKEFDADNLLSPRSLVDVCAGLVTIDSTSQIIRLMHYTTQQYFDKARLHLFKDAEVDVSRACLTYLSYDFGTEFGCERIRDEAFLSHPFLDYASHHWFSHVISGLLPMNPDPAFLKAVARFKSSDSITFSIDLLMNMSGGYWPGFRTFRTFKRRPAFRLEVASGHGCEELVTVLLDQSTERCPGFNSSLVFASYGGRLNVVKLLIHHGAPIDSRFPDEGVDVPCTMSALEGACRRGHLSVAEFLVEHGADIHGRQTAVLPPIHAAASSHSLKIIDLLINKGANVNARDSQRRTACHFAANDVCIDLARRLIDAGCDLELVDDDGNTVLHYAAYGGSSEMITLLVERGADACAKNKDGETARKILENSLLLTDSYHGKGRNLVEQIAERLRQAEQNSSASDKSDLGENNPVSSGQTVSAA